MKTFNLLLKIRINEALEISKIKYTKSKLERCELILSFLIKIICYFTLFSGITYLFSFLSDLGYKSSLPIISYFVSFVLSIFITLISINELFNGNEDLEFLLSTPIPSFFHVLILFLSIYIKTLFAVALIEIPMMIVCCSFSTILPFIGGMLLTSLPGSGIASLCGIILILSLAKSPKKDQIYSSIILFCILLISIIIVLFSTLISKIILNNGTSEKIVTLLISELKFMRMYQYAIVDYHFGYRFLFIGLSFIWYLFFILFLTASYRYIVIALKTPIAYKKKSKLNTKINKVSKAIFLQELKNIIRTKNYLIKAISLLLFNFILLNGLIIFNKELILKLNYKLLGFIILSIGLCNTTYKSYSLDTKTNWILEVSGVNNKTSFICKILVNLILTIPFCLITGIISISLLNYNILFKFLLIIIPLLYSLINALNSELIAFKFSKKSDKGRSFSFIFGYLSGIIIPLILIILI